MLGVLAAVAVSRMLSPPMHSYELFYFFCAVSEMCVGLVALLCRSNASTAVAILCAALIVMHVFGAVLDGYPPMSPYRIIVPLLEHAEILACILLSKPLIDRIRNHETP